MSNDITKLHLYDIKKIVSNLFYRYAGKTSNIISIELTAESIFICKRITCRYITCFHQHLNAITSR